MFGGLGFMVNDKMCVGIMKDKIMVRLNPAIYDDVMEKEGCNPMDFTGKPMKGYVFVDFDQLDTKNKLEYWIQLALDFNISLRDTEKLKCKP